ncbi:putative pentatricopeptide repeat-containing protein At3g15130 [Lactuca sativa]|uniref:DYW domain-containing protein n=1 Tax=Lactuca sativa TaxID=4236 RepID=A0A9R1WCX5_LACSA|nr:putative pentatricopeptide repeat-containing protein At3g15130 [Lactuca sativa]XP_042755288.1 putative pentatricopeptide repeat-containing protein At3g15130 [Lactuca sativa]XP_042755289.1 putative pentatricopeptide repeat-containing protein At3g15130 [Lactuca sativa]XP_042755290.1 putative pentatricopeptide repeat-containing protein At3g15130 [Lactuca sativa]XP_042755291.1 putative pentatricopeptide repeat-containing protein At3g15130 [Lactuca sativa]XP_042755292.1 putative pentatricopeptid
MMNERQRFAQLLRVCSKNLFLDQGLQVHTTVVKSGYGFDMMINNDLIDMYGKCGRVEMACKVFDRMLQRNVVSWTSLMCGYLNQGNAKSSLLLLSRMGSSMVKPNEFTFSTNFKACGFVGVPENGMQVHGWCCKTGFEWFPVVGNSLIDMYSKCGRIEAASQVFDEVPERSLITWNAMISGYAVGHMGDKSLDLFKEMQIQGKNPDGFTFTSTLKACAGLGELEAGRQIHGFLISMGFLLSQQTIVAGSLIDLYAKCGSLRDAQKVFDQVERKSVISWTTLVVGYAQEGNLSKAMESYSALRKSSFPIDGFVLSSVMAVFADFALLEQGKQMHAYITKVPFGLDISVANSVMDMYLKCGVTEDADKVFEEMPKRNVVSWTIMITGYGKHGLGEQAINIFENMKSENISPDGVTYLAILSSCSHSGLVEKSQQYFSRLLNDPKIKPNVEHYACMVDLLGRSGRLKEARNLIKNMPVKPNSGIWQTLLSACKLHKDLEMGREVGEILMKMDDVSVVNYVMMSSIYANAGLWKESEKVRKSVKVKGLNKVGGQSWVEIDKSIHFFYNGDERHPLTSRIHEKLKEMEKRLKEEVQFAYEVRFSLHDVEEESREESLRVHSEKLAIGLFLVHNDGIEKERGCIRIFKNLRVCGDCHEFIKGLSKILTKVFLVRDANRFHKFENGECSCGDYW